MSGGLRRRGRLHRAFLRLAPGVFPPEVFPPEIFRTGGRDSGPLPPGHPLSWGLLQALLSPENRAPWPGTLRPLQPGCQPDLLTLWKDAA